MAIKSKKYNFIIAYFMVILNISICLLNELLLYNSNKSFFSLEWLIILYIQYLHLEKNPHYKLIKINQSYAGLFISRQDLNFLLFSFKLEFKFQQDPSQELKMSKT
ncbi:hypothetical protein ACJX0J_028958 [Zea mays]